MDLYTRTILFLVCLLKASILVKTSSTTPSMSPTPSSTAPASTTPASTSTAPASSTMSSTSAQPSMSTGTQSSSMSPTSMMMSSTSSMPPTTTGSSTMSSATPTAPPTQTPIAPPTLGVACDNNSACMADNSFCDMNSTCKCNDGFLQVNSTNCTPVSALAVQVMRDFVNESQIHIRWNLPIQQDVNITMFELTWTIMNMNESMESKAPDDRMLVITVSQPGEDVTLHITTIATDGANMTVNYTTMELLTARPAKPFFNYSQDFMASTANQEIMWMQEGMFDRFVGNVTEVGKGSYMSINTTNTKVTLNTLVPGRRYIIYLRAKKNDIYGMEASFEFGVNPAEPSAPSGVFAIDIGQTNFTLNVSEPGMPNGMLMGYLFSFEKKLYTDSMSNGTATVYRNYTEESMLFSFSNEDLGAKFIVPGAFFTASVYSVNEEFNGTVAFTYNFQTEESVPGIVNGLSLENENEVVNQANFRWNRPDMPNGNITAYQLIVRSSSRCREYRICNGMCSDMNISFSNGCAVINIVYWDNLTVSQQSVAVPVLLDGTVGTSYTGTVSAYTAVGRGQYQNVTFNTVILVPGKPTITQATTTSDSLTLTWDPPAVYPGRTLYTVDIRNNVSYSQIGNPYSDCRDSLRTSCNIGSLEANWRYSFKITTKTVVGESVTDERIIETIDSNPERLNGISLEQSQDDCQTFILTWQDPPLEDRNSIIKQYEVLSNSQRQIVPSVITTQFDSRRTTYTRTFTGLQEDAQYFYTIVAVSTNNKRSGQAFSRPLKVDCGTPAGVIVAIVLVFVLVLAIILGVIFFVYRRKLKEIEAQYRPNQNQLRQDGFMPVRTDPVQEEIEKQRRKQLKRPFRLCDAQMVYDKMAADSNRLFSLEYEDLKKLSYKGTADAANAEGENNSGNKAKNRYVNILPFDHSRVILAPIEDDRCSDYINANYIPGYTYEREFIASQGPLPGTVNDFWRMVWEKSVTIIVMLTKCKEGSADKCEHYWPHTVNEPQQYGDVVVNVISVSNMDKFDINIFHVTQGDYTRTVKHFQFLEWPDFSANVETGTVIDFVQTVRTHITPEMKGPAVIHCSAGVGRTGTYISVDYLLQFVRDKDASAEVDIFDWVLSMRKNRTSMVQVEKQYIFIHMALLDILERKKKGLIQDDRDEARYNLENEVVYENTAFEGEDDEKMNFPVENSTKEDGQPLTEL